MHLNFLFSVADVADLFQNACKHCGKCVYQRILADRPHNTRCCAWARFFLIDWGSIQGFTPLMLCNSYLYGVEMQHC